MPANKWLATKPDLDECQSTMFGSQAIPEKIPATARLDRGFTGWKRKSRLRQITEWTRLAIVRQIPVAFEDETGFHLGVQQIRKDEAMSWERANLFAGDRYF